MELVQVEVTGLRELEKNLNLMSEAMAKKVMAKACRDSMKIMRKACADNAPRSGRINARVSKKGKKIRLADGILLAGGIKYEGAGGATVWMTVGLRKKPEDESVFYGRLLEFGTVHITAKPWMRPAFDANSRKVLKAVGDSLGVGIEKVRLSTVNKLP